MSVTKQTHRNGRQAGQTTAANLRRRTLSQLIALALTAGSFGAYAATPPAFSPAWLAQKQGQPGSATPTGTSPNAGVGGAPGGATAANLLLQQRVQQSITNLNRSAQVVAAQIAAQKAAQDAAAQTPSSVPDGIAAGGLSPAALIAKDPTLWQNANAPVQTVAGGKTTVEVKQNDKKAILTWDSFNVGRDTTMYFNQSAGNQNGGKNDWIALNRINDPSGSPSKILGQIKAEGTVYLLNRNGMIFGAGAKVNTHSLIASSLDLYGPNVAASNALYMKEGLAARNDGGGMLTATFTDGRNHDVVIEKGASITTGAQGFALVAAPNVSNAGLIVADDGQATLAATTRLENGTSGDLNVSDQTPFGQDFQANRGDVSNTGLIQSRRGQVHMLGYSVEQAGVVLASTSIAHPGSIELRAQNGFSSNDGSAARSGPIVLGVGSVTAILPEKDGTTTSSSADADKTFVNGHVDIVGGSVTLQGGSLVEAPGAAVNLKAIRDTAPIAHPPETAGRIYVDSGAVIDVSGLVNVVLPMSALLVNIPRIGQNELADSPLLRNSFLYTQKNVVVDSTQSGTRDDGLDWIGSPILNVKGYVENVPRDISQMLTRGGTIGLDGNEVIVRSGAQLKLDGGYIAYQAGWITTPNLLGADGRIYNIADADPSVNYVGFAGQYSASHARWGVTETYNSPLLGGTRRWDDGFVVGSNAGTLNIHTNRALVLDGDISAATSAGTRQVANGSQPTSGKLNIDTMAASSNRDVYQRGIRLQQSSQLLDALAPGFTADTAWEDVQKAQDGTATDDGSLRSWLVVSADMVSRAGFDSLSVNTKSSIVEAAGTNLTVNSGGTISLRGGRIDIFGNVTAPAGSILLTTGYPIVAPGPQGVKGQLQRADIHVAAGATLSTRGLWVNDTGQGAGGIVGDRFVNGGTISLSTEQAFLGNPVNHVDGTGSIDLAKGSVLDVSGGGYVGTDGRVRMKNGVPEGRGGDVSLVTYKTPDTDAYGIGQTPPDALDSAHINLNGDILSYGFGGGGNLTLQAVQIQVGGDASDMASGNGLHLAPSFFDGQGFDNYILHAITDGTVAADTNVRVVRANMLPVLDELSVLPTGSDLYRSSGYAGVGELDAYRRWATRDTRKGHGPGFSLSAGDFRDWKIQVGALNADAPVYAGVTGSVLVDRGASVRVDADGVINLSGMNATVVDGSIIAPGGDIEITNKPLQYILPKIAPRVWLGDHSLVDASGISLIDTQAAAGVRSGSGIPVGETPRTGTVLGGGTISIESTGGGYVVAQAGALIDVSGAADSYDLPVAASRLNGSTVDYVPTPVWSDAGTIAFGAAAGLLSDATLLARGGSAEAEGGTLSVEGMDSGGFDRRPQPTGVLVQQSGSVVPMGATRYGAIESGAPSGIIHFVADSLANSGISNLAIGPAVGPVNTLGIVLPIGFAGNVDVSLGRSFTAYSTGYLALPDGATSLQTGTGYAAGNGHVRISAPYVNISGTKLPVPSSPIPLALAGDGTLDIDADFIDIGGTVDLQRWRDANFNATGDIRFTLPASLAFGVDGKANTGLLFSTGNLTFKAAQLYPATGYRFVIDANASGIADADGHARNTTVTILPGGPSNAPLSAAGALLVDADHIVQNGTIRAPAGSLVLGVTDPVVQAADFGIDPTIFPLVATTSVNLGAGSLTSVSLNGLTVPYGTTVDGVEWRYNGNPAANSSDLVAPPAKDIQVHGSDVALDKGAGIDLSGGGALQAGEWVPGVGGTRDLLAQPANGRAVYAVIPGYKSPVAAHDAAFENASSAPDIGKSVYLSGIPGLPAGMYTLLPAGYAELPGAYRIVQDTTSVDSVLGRNAVHPDGSYSVAGYFADGLTGTRDARNTTFLVQSAKVWQQYSQYRLTDADKFFGDQATKSGIVAPQLLADAGRLVLAAGKQLNIGATLTAEPAKGGRSSQVDIAGQAIQIVGAGENIRDGYLNISADGLTQLNAGSLLIGGTRHHEDDGDRIDGAADSVVLSNDAAHPLAGREIMLVARGASAPGAEGVLLESGSVLQAQGDSNPAGSQSILFGSNAGKDAAGNPTSAVSGDGAMIRVSQNGAANVVRRQVPGTGGVAGTSTGRLTIDGGATVNGGSALTLDATGATRVDANATFSAKAIDANSNKITFVGDGVNGGDNGLVIGPRTLDLFRSADEVTLRSRGAIDFLGNLDISLANALTLNAGALVGDGGDVSIHAARLGFGNALGGVAPAPAAHGGRLDVHADEIDFGPGASALQGFANFSASATKGVVGQGRGGMDFGGADVSLSAPVFIASGGSDTSLTTGGALSLVNSGGAAMASDALGGSLTLKGGSVAVGMNLDATAGTLNISATQGDLVIAPGTRLDVAGTNKVFFDTTTYAPGGTLALAANRGSIDIGAGASLLFGGASKGGDAGSFSALAANSVLLGGTFDGHAAKGYRGGYFTLGSGAVLDLDALARLTAMAGATGLVDITSGAGDLALSAGNTLTAGKVYLYANGGTARIDGTIDATAPAGSRIEVYGRKGVDIEGNLIATSSIAAQRGGDVILGTAGTGDGSLNSAYGYENVQAGDAGYIHVGAKARIDVSGGSSDAFSGGKVSMRAPLLADGNVPITLDGGNANIVGARDVTIEPFVVWSTKDTQQTDKSKYFDGIVDPAGWYGAGADGKPTLVAGKWYDATGKQLDAPADDAQLKKYLSANYFIPDAANAGHQSFYGYVGGNAVNGPGALMGFIQNPGFTFGPRFATIANVHVRPGVELRNPVDGVNGGTIGVLTNWNLGAGVTDSAGKIQLAYRYGAEAPILTIRASGNLDLKASITDGFYQQNNGAVLSDPPAPPPPPLPDNGYADAVAAYQKSEQYLSDNGIWNGSINLKDGAVGDGMTPGGGTADITKDRYYQPLQAPLKDQSVAYYANYKRYVGEVGDADNQTWAYAFWSSNTSGGFLTYKPTALIAPQPDAYTTYADYVAAYETWLESNFYFDPDHFNSTPSPILTPIDSSYTAYSSNYGLYIDGHNTYYNYVANNVGNFFWGTQLFYAPFVPKSDAVVRNVAYDNALASYQTSQAYLDANGIWNGSINLKDGAVGDGMTPGGGRADISKDPYYQPLQAPLLNQSNDYYANYQRYIGEVGDANNQTWAYAFASSNSSGGFLAYKPTTLVAPQPGSYTTYTDYAAAYETWLESNFYFDPDHFNTTPSPILTPIDSNYTAYTANYGQYIDGHSTYYNYVANNVGNFFWGSQLFYAPFVPKSDAAPTNPGGGNTPIPVPASAANNSPSNMPSLGSPASLASATLLGGASTSYRFVAGSDIGAVDPLATSAGGGSVVLDGHFSVKDMLTDPSVVNVKSPFAGKTLLLPTTIRTGTGSIDMVSGGDIQWADEQAPAVVYTAGAPASGTQVGTDVSVLRPSEKAQGIGDTLPDMLVTGFVNPENAGDIGLKARGNIDAIQYVVDADGSVTKGAKGQSVSQYWWQWMQIGNAADGSRSSIDFGNFGQGIMSVGGNVSVDAGGNISELSVSLPTTWYANAARDAITTVGRGNLDVHAGGDILSGSYFVAKGLGRIDADGAVAASPLLSAINIPGFSPSVVSPVSTLFAMQDADMSVNARLGADIGGIYDPSYYNSRGLFGFLLPAGHADMQGYSQDSALSVATTAGNITVGSLRAPGVVFGAGGIAGPVLPATLSLTAFGGDIGILTNGELYPSADGNLTILANGSIGFSRQTVQDSQGIAFGLIDASPDSMPSPLAPTTNYVSRIVTNGGSALNNATGHQAVPLHGDDSDPVRIYALGGDITDGTDAPNGFNYLSLIISPAKQALIYASRDIVNLSLIGQHTHAADITRVAAGRDIYDTAILPHGPFASFIIGGYELVPSLVLGGPGNFLVEAGRDIGPLTSQVDVAKGGSIDAGNTPTGIQSVGNFFNPYLPHEGADVNVAFGVGSGIDTAAFITHYLDTPGGVDGFGSLMPDLVDFMNRRVAGEVVDTGYARDKLDISLSAEQARAMFAQQPEYVQRLFAEKALFKILAAVGGDYNTPSSKYFNQYARGYAAIDTLFPASLGYTANGQGQGGLNGAASTVDTGNLDIRSTSIQTQQGGDITILGPGGQALIGSTSAPPPIALADGTLLDGPNTMGVLTLEQGNINMFTDRSVLLAQSRIFTEQGGNLVMWSSNGDINAGQGAKTTAEIPPPTYLCDVDAWCRIDARGQVSGAGIATLQTIEGAPPGNVFLVAPRGTVDAGDAGIRVAGNLVIAAARVANADNIQVKGDSTGIPLVPAVNIGALNAASAAANAASKVAEDVARKQQSDARDHMPSVISVQVLRDGNNSSSIDRPVQGYDVTSPVQVLGAGKLDSTHAKMLTEEERGRISNN
ncbi:filamentous hemagglutinin family protein [Luteibacter rhizovicinus]|uniref:Filamentous hemagglutinin family protein n=1 Tax=Luteibacter rhizovicinus TaxID=242606 RepID=A0A4R3YLT3_9GAMM|nr:filamentous haemagglutinin family protein [Luteibacter rhizovicinus]TCV91773.1 filamentous hemagglutinin family protein [Luteibacter rhizovicinus]